MAAEAVAVSVIAGLSSNIPMAYPAALRRGNPPGVRRMADRTGLVILGQFAPVSPGSGVRVAQLTAFPLASEGEVAGLDSIIAVAVGADGVRHWLVGLEGRHVVVAGMTAATVAAGGQLAQQVWIMAGSAVLGMIRGLVLENLYLLMAALAGSGERRAPGVGLMAVAAVLVLLRNLIVSQYGPFRRMAFGACAIALESKAAFLMAAAAIVVAARLAEQVAVLCFAVAVGAAVSQLECTEVCSMALQAVLGMFRYLVNRHVGRLAMAHRAERVAFRWLAMGFVANRAT